MSGPEENSWKRPTPPEVIGGFPDVDEYERPDILFPKKPLTLQEAIAAGLLAPVRIVHVPLVIEGDTGVAGEHLQLLGLSEGEQSAYGGITDLAPSDGIDPGIQIATPISDKFLRSQTHEA